MTNGGGRARVSRSTHTIHEPARARRAEKTPPCDDVMRETRRRSPIDARGRRDWIYIEGFRPSISSFCETGISSPKRGEFSPVSENRCVSWCDDGTNVFTTRRATPASARRASRPARPVAPPPRARPIATVPRPPDPSRPPLPPEAVALPAHLPSLRPRDDARGGEGKRAQEERPGRGRGAGRHHRRGRGRPREGPGVHEAGATRPPDAPPRTTRERFARARGRRRAKRARLFPPGFVRRGPPDTIAAGCRAPPLASGERRSPSPPPSRSSLPSRS